MKTSTHTFVVMGAIVLALVACWVFIFARLTASKHAYVEETKLLLEERQKELNYLSTHNLLRETEADRLELAQLFVTEDTVVSFLEELELLGRRAGIVLELSSVQPIKDTSLNFFFEVSGSFTDIYEFVKLSELLPHKLAVDKVDIRKVDGFIDEGGKPLPIWKGAVTLSLKSFIVEKNETATSKN